MALSRTHTAFMANQLAERANTPIVTQVAVRFAYLVMTWDDRYKMRRELKRMPQFRLDDIGLTQAQVAREVRKPFWRS